MTLVHSPLYAALLGFILLALSARVIVYRRSHKISLGDTGDKALLKRMRAQSNFVEYAPMGLILLVLVELTGAPAIAVHVLGLMLVAGRAMHNLAKVRVGRSNRLARSNIPIIGIKHGTASAVLLFFGPQLQDTYGIGRRERMDTALSGL